MACGGYLGHVGVCVSPCFSQQLVLRSRCRDRWRRAKFSMRISRRSRVRGDAWFDWSKFENRRVDYEIGSRISRILNPSDQRTVILDRKPLFARYTGQNFEPKVASICSQAGCTRAKIWCFGPYIVILKNSIKTGTCIYLRYIRKQ